VTPSACAGSNIHGVAMHALVTRIRVLVRRVGNMDVRGSCPRVRFPRRGPGLCPGRGSGLKAHGREACHDDKDQSIGQVVQSKCFPRAALRFHTRAGGGAPDAEGQGSAVNPSLGRVVRPCAVDARNQSARNTCR
jgi:hypothetical protein